MNRFKLAALIAGVGLLGLITFQPKRPNLEFVEAGKEIVIDIADDNQERQQGLSKRPVLPKNSGMLFVFEMPARPGFWMKDMNFPLDIIWIDSNKRIVAIKEDFQPNTYPETTMPPGLIKYVLEVNAGFARDNGIEVGQTISF